MLSTTLKSEEVFNFEPGLVPSHVRKRKNLQKLMTTPWAIFQIDVSTKDDFEKSLPKRSGRYEPPEFVIWRLT